MGNDQPALHALFACELGFSEPEIRLEHAFVLGKTSTTNGKIHTVLLCKNNCKLL